MILVRYHETDAHRLNNLVKHILIVIMFIAHDICKVS